PKQFFCFCIFHPSCAVPLDIPDLKKLSQKSWTDITHKKMLLNVFMQANSNDCVDEFTPALYANTQEILLERDIQRTLANTFPNEHPEAFILIPSAEKFIVDGNCIQLIGIGNEQGEFDFYRQVYPVTGGEHQVEALMWTYPLGAYVSLNTTVLQILSKRLAGTVLIFTESSDQLSRATDRVPGLPASPGYAPAIIALPTTILMARKCLKQ
ncbi:TPA: hypothetical protein ACHKZD_005121, partial [Escherichia coli]